MAPTDISPDDETPRDPIRVAAEHGLDLSLLRANLRRTPAERLRQLDGMMEFVRAMRRARPAANA